MSSEDKNKFDSLILNLESLIKEYDTLLLQYNQVQSDYINNLLTNQNNSSNPSLSIINNSAFWGTSGISSSRIDTVDQCSALCSNTPGCSGATFKSSNGNEDNCWLRSGEGDVIASSDDQYAIIPKNKEYLLTLQTLNSQLIDVNDSILKIFQNGKDIFTNGDIERLNKYNLLTQNYANLEKERFKILNELKKYQSLEERQNQSELLVKKNYYNYILLLFVVILCILLLSETFVGVFTNFIGVYGTFILTCIIILLLFCIFSYVV
jgi:hypothetical protein